jgi:hypothetical protein
MRADFKPPQLLDRVTLSKPHSPFSSVSMLDLLFPMSGDPTPSPVLTQFDPRAPKATQTQAERSLTGEISFPFCVFDPFRVKNLSAEGRKNPGTPFRFPSRPGTKRIADFQRSKVQLYPWGRVKP